MTWVIRALLSLLFLCFLVTWIDLTITTWISYSGNLDSPDLDVQRSPEHHFLDFLAMLSCFFFSISRTGFIILFS